MRTALWLPAYLAFLDEAVAKAPEQLLSRIATASGG
jgi:hypothetical protein